MSTLEELREWLDEHERYADVVVITHGKDEQLVIEYLSSGISQSVPKGAAEVHLSEATSIDSEVSYVVATKAAGLFIQKVGERQIPNEVKLIDNKLSWVLLVPKGTILTVRK